VTTPPRIPSRDQFTTDREVHFHIPANSRPDNFGRLQFTAFWPTDQPWVPGGVRGQVFHTNPGEAAARWQADGFTVHVIRFEEAPL
jgi:hypothetical protein